MLSTSIEDGFEHASGVLESLFRQVAETITQHSILTLAVLVSSQMAFSTSIEARITDKVSDLWYHLRTNHLPEISSPIGPIPWTILRSSF